jgi:ribonuclease P protein component
MLPRELRLPSSEFLARGYRTIATPYFSLKAKQNGLSQNRIGVIISVAAAKSAARRNFWKRQVRARMANGEWRMANGFDFLIIFSKKGDLLTKAEFEKELEKAYLGVIAPNPSAQPPRT